MYIRSEVCSSLEPVLKKFESHPWCQLACFWKITVNNFIPKIFKVKLFLISTLIGFKKLNT